MCHKPTKEETARSEAMNAAVAPEANGSALDSRHEPWTYPHPRGNQETDRTELERGTEKLATVLGH